MRDWVLHHIHFVIILDTVLHGVMLGLVVSAWHFFGKLVKLTRNHPKTVKIERRIALSIMALMLGWVTWLTVSAFYSCLTHYGEWWNRPAAPTCKVCHCGKTSCHAQCSEENMCAMRCEGLCKRGHE